MIMNPDITAALARERSRTFLAEAEAARQARQARQARREAVSGRIVPWDRPVRLPPSASAPLLARSLAWLRGRAGRARLAGRSGAPAAADLRCYADVHHRDREAQPARLRRDAGIRGTSGTAGAHAAEMAVTSAEGWAPFPAFFMHHAGCARRNAASISGTTPQ